MSNSRSHAQPYGRKHRDEAQGHDGAPAGPEVPDPEGEEDEHGEQDDGEDEVGDLGEPLKGVSGSERYRTTMVHLAGRATTLVLYSMLLLPLGPINRNVGTHKVHQVPRSELRTHQDHPGVNDIDHDDVQADERGEPHHSRTSERRVLCVLPIDAVRYTGLSDKVAVHQLEQRAGDEGLKGHADGTGEQGVVDVRLGCQLGEGTGCVTGVRDKAHHTRLAQEVLGGIVRRISLKGTRKVVGHPSLRLLLDSAASKESGNA